MSKSKCYTNRLNELLVDSIEVDPEPSAIHINHQDDLGTTSFLDIALKNHLAVAKDDISSGNGNCWRQDESDNISTLSWHDFLDAIHRSEFLGYLYRDDQIIQITDPRQQYIRAKSRKTNRTEKNSNMLSLPIQVVDQDIGSIELIRDVDQLWSPSETELLKTIVNQITRHIENLRLVEQAERFRFEAEKAVRNMVQEGWEQFLAGKTKKPLAYIYDQNTVQAFEHYSDNEISDSISLTQGHIIKENLKVRDEVVGELQVSSLDPENGKFIATMAERLSQHIENLRLLEQTEFSRQQLDRKANELETVARVSTAAVTSLDPQTLLKSVVDFTKANFDLTHAQIFILDEDLNALRLVAGSGRGGQEMEHDVQIVALSNRYSTVAHVARTGAGIIVNNFQNERIYRRDDLLPDTRSELTVPLIAGNQLLGVFDVHSTMENRFVEDDLQTYSILASQIAVALRNAHLYSEQMATVDRLRELDHLKSAFLANMSHELRTPLNAIIGFTQVIMEEIDGPLTGLMRSDLELIEKNGQHLLKLINDVLDMAKIEAGRMSLTVDKFDLCELIRDVIDTAMPLARDKNLFLTLVNDEGENIIVEADEFRTRQVLLNILGNSIKFTDTGGVQIQVEKSEKGEIDIPMLRITFHDTGIGIPEDKLEAIFEAFSQVDTSTTRKAGGTGLGLPISRRLVELHGGLLWAESTGVPGEGSRFIIELPVIHNKYHRSFEGEI